MAGPAHMAFEQRPDPAEVGFGKRPDIEHGRKSNLTVEDGHLCRQCGDIAIKPQILDVDEPSATTNTPAVPEQASLHRLPHGLPPEKDRLDGEEFGCVFKLDIQRTRERGAVEQDGLLRQPIDPRAATDLDRGFHFCRTHRSFVDFFAGLRRHIDPRTRRGNEAPIHPVAAREAAGGVDDNGLHGMIESFRQPDLGRSLLEKFGQAGPAAERLGRKMTASSRPLRSRACRHQCHQPSPHITSRRSPAIEARQGINASNSCALCDPPQHRPDADDISRIFRQTPKRKAMITAGRRDTGNSA